MKAAGSPCSADRILGDLSRGIAAGATAWWAMDRTLSGIYNRTGFKVRRRETAARAGVPALEVLAERVAGTCGTTLSTAQRERAGTYLQWGVGLAAGALYAVLRERVPASRAGGGLLYGTAFSLVVDEGLTPMLGLAPGPRSFPWQTHARGFVGHLVFGAVAEATLTAMEHARNPVAVSSRWRASRRRQEITAR